MLWLRKSKKGFTLIELMVVVAIIGVLALLGLRMYSTQQDKAKESIVKANAGSVQVTIQTELVDVPTITLAEALALTDLLVLRNPFTGVSGVTAAAEAAAAGAVGDDTTATMTEGMVGVHFSDLVFVIHAYGKDGGLIPNYVLTAQQ